MEIGMTVVCIKTHSQGAVKEGDVRKIKGMRINCCGNLVLDVGIIADTTRFNYLTIGERYYCTSKRHLETFDGIWWINNLLFRPLEDLYNTEIEELMNEVNEKQPFEV